MIRKAGFIAVGCLAVLAILYFISEPLDVSGALPPEDSGADRSSVELVEGALEYAQAQPDFAGEWLDPERDVMMYAFTGDLEKHRASLEAAGVDFSTGQYEVVRLTRTYADLSALKAALNDDDNFRSDWDIVWVYIDSARNMVGVSVAWEDPPRAARLEEALVAVFGQEGSWFTTQGVEPSLRQY